MDLIRFLNPGVISLVRRRNWKHLIALSLVLGPISGPLADAAYRNLKGGETVLGFLYAFAIPVSWFDLLAASRFLLVHWA